MGVAWASGCPIVHGGVRDPITRCMYGIMEPIHSPICSGNLMTLSSTPTAQAEKPWLDLYAQGVAPSLAPYPHPSLVDVLAENAREAPEAPALIFQGNKITYAHLNGLSDAFARGLVRLGVQPGERLALVLTTSVQAVIAQFGAWKAGVIVVPLNPLYPEKDLETYLNLSGATLAVALTPFYAKVKAVQAQHIAAHGDRHEYQRVPAAAPALSVHVAERKGRRPQSGDQQRGFLV